MDEEGDGGEWDFVRVKEAIGNWQLAKRRRIRLLFCFRESGLNIARRQDGKKADSDDHADRNQHEP